MKSFSHDVVASWRRFFLTLHKLKKLAVSSPIVFTTISDAQMRWLIRKPMQRALQNMFTKWHVTTWGGVVTKNVQNFALSSRGHVAQNGESKNFWTKALDSFTQICAQSLFDEPWNWSISHEKFHSGHGDLSLWSCAQGLMGKSDIFSPTHNFSPGCLMPMFGLPVWSPCQGLSVKHSHHAIRHVLAEISTKNTKMAILMQFWLALTKRGCFTLRFRMVGVQAFHSSATLRHVQRISLLCDQKASWWATGHWKHPSFCQIPKIITGVRPLTNVCWKQDLGPTTSPPPP